MAHKEKYIKYKTKYLELKKTMDGSEFIEPTCTKMNFGNIVENVGMMHLPC